MAPLTLLLSLVALGAAPAPPTVHEVGPSGDFPTLTAAVAAALPGDTIRVAPGVYREPTLVLDKAVTILGTPGAILDGEGARGLVRIAADSVTVAGLTPAGTAAAKSRCRQAGSGSPA